MEEVPDVLDYLIELRIWERMLSCALGETMFLFYISSFYFYNRFILQLALLLANRFLITGRYVRALEGTTSRTSLRLSV